MSTHLQEGNKAPNFSGTATNGETIKLNSFKGKKVVLFFYPEDDTPTCTIQACNLRDYYSDLQKAGITVIGISPNSMDDHKKFTEKFSLPFPLIADTRHSIIKKYGVWGQKQLYGRIYDGLHRTTFLIDEKGVIVKIFLRPKNKAHAAEILLFWKTVKK